MRGEFIDLAGVRVYCHAFGSRGSGDPIVLLHGAFTSSHLWQDFLPRLPKGHRVLVVDLLGHGRSDPPGGAPMTVDAHADRVVQLLDVLGVPLASLVGHGMGAAVAMCVACRQPDRVTRLALVNPVLLADTAHDMRLTARMSRVIMLLSVWQRLAPGWLASALHSAILPAYTHRDTGARSLDVHLQAFRSRDGRDAACAQLKALRASGAMAGAALQPGTLSCPVALVLGTGDPWLPAARALRLEQALVRSTSDSVVVHRVPGVAHMIPEEAPDQLGRWITDLLARPPLLSDG
jgi:pimeloyl-ACP methyl ester carboxylesterase